MLHQVVRENLETFLPTTARADPGGLPAFLEQEFRGSTHRAAGRHPRPRQKPLKKSYRLYRLYQHEVTAHVRRSRRPTT